MVTAPTPLTSGRRGGTRPGEAWVFIAGGALVLLIALVLGVVLLLGFHGLAVFWPKDLVRVETKGGTTVLGIEWRREAVPPDEAGGGGGAVASADQPAMRTLYRIGNRRQFGKEFEWVADADVVATSRPTDAAVVERLEWGPGIGTFDGGVLTLSNGETVAVAPDEIVRVVRPNAEGTFGKLGVYLARTWEFLSAPPRESNTEGGILPAIMGTVLMVLLMTLAAVPLGVVGALYLNEYAKQGPLVRLVRLAVSNLAGVPSIVFGMFGLAFFVYTVGSWIDARAFPDASGPTFGTGGLLWASLTLALLTVPVVIVSTEEALRAVPRAQRAGALALGATRWQSLRTVVLPASVPGILTGVILAISRGAGEVAPLMLTGVVKLAPSPLIDGAAPFVHLDRKFMHLGFHIYDVSFQSPNVEASKPIVYATALLLLVLVVVLNSTAIVYRNRVRRRLSGSTF